MKLARRAGALVLAAAVAAVTAAEAVSPKRFTVRTQSEWLAGEAEGLRLDADGTVALAPKVSTRALLEEAVVWAVAPGKRGVTWAGTGSRGRLLQVQESGEFEVAATFAELQVTALLKSGDGVIAATAPEGAVYRLHPGRETEELARPQAEYIWSLAENDGALYIGTGVDGVVYALRDGDLSVFYDSADVHVTSLRPHPSGGLVAGTAERGLVLRLLPDGQVRVLYDSGFREVKGLAVAAAGAIYAAVNGAQSYRDAAAPNQPAGEASVTVTAGSSGGSSQQPARQALRLAPPETAGGNVTAQVLHLVPGRPVEVVASLRGQIVHALALGPGGAPHVATSKHLLVPASGGRTTTVALEGKAQVSALAAAGDRILVGTTGPTRLFALSGGSERTGTYTSKVFEAGGDALWGRLSWDAEPADAAVKVETRSGQTREPDDTWSGWAEPLTRPGKIASPPARYLQWRLRLSGGPGAMVRSVAASYLPSNRRPEIKSFEAHPPGAVYQKVASSSNVVESEPPPIPGLFEELTSPQGEPTQGKRHYRRGAQTLTWDVADPDQDHVRVALRLRARDGGPELRVSDRVEGKSYAFDTDVLPDGWYVATLEASDAPSNPDDRALSARRDSTPFLVDNTPPRINVVYARVDGRRIGEARFEASDELSDLWKAEWSLDGRQFAPLTAEDGLTDGDREAYVVTTGELDRGAHLVVVRVYDLANRTATRGAWLEVR